MDGDNGTDPSTNPGMLIATKTKQSKSKRRTTTTTTDEEEQRKKKKANHKNIDDDGRKENDNDEECEDVNHDDPDDTEKARNEDGIVRPLLVYTDGACENNGKPSARAGFGVWFGEDGPPPISSPLEGPIQTNQRAEMTAVIAALEVLLNQGTSSLSSKNKKRPKQAPPVIIFSDSKYTINGLKAWMPNWKSNNWRTSNDKPVKNKVVKTKRTEIPGTKRSLDVA